MSTCEPITLFSVKAKELPNELSTCVCRVMGRCGEMWGDVGRRGEMWGTSCPRASAARAEGGGGVECRVGCARRSVHTAGVRTVH